MIFITPNTMRSPDEMIKSSAAVVTASSTTVNMVTPRLEWREADPISLALGVDQDFGGHWAPGSTFGKLWITLTLPSDWTSPRYIVSGAWRCLFIWILPRGPSTETSSSAFSTFA